MPKDIGKNSVQGYYIFTNTCFEKTALIFSNKNEIKYWLDRMLNITKIGY